MTNGNNDVRELEDLLTELEGQGALPVGPYSDEDDAVTQLMDAPLGEQEWMVQITPLDRRMMSTDQISAELATGNLVNGDMLVWRHGMSDWAPIASVEEWRSAAPVAERPAPRPLPPPPTPVPPARLGSSAMASPSPIGRAPLPPPPSVPYAMPRPLTPPPDVPPPGPALPLFNSAFAPSPPPSNGAGMPELGSGFNVPPPAAAPVPPPAVARVNTQRPVAVDFSEMEPSRPAPIRLLVGSGVAAFAMIVGTVYALSAGGVFDTNTEPKPEPVAAAASAKPSAEPPAAAAEPSVAKPSEAEAPASAEAEQPQTQPVSAKDDEPTAAEPAADAPAPEARAELAASDDPVQKAAKASRAEKASKAEKAEKAAKSEKAEKSSEAASASGEEKDADGEATSSHAARHGAHRTKRTSSSEETAAAEPRHSKPRATAVAAEVSRAETEESPKGGDAPGSTFNREAAKTALDDAAAQAKNCRPAGGPNGSGKVQVRYEPTGKVGAVSILTPMFDNTTTGSCLVMVFRRASVPAFTGAPSVVMNKAFEIP
jgi:hypothetical protein